MLIVLKAEFLRKKYPKFIYEKYFYKIYGENLEIFFVFKIKPNINFQHKIVIENIKKNQIKIVDKKMLDNLIFHLGLIEIPSYWKITCSPEIVIKAGYLNKKQIAWWKNLFIDGMGQFFYENKINFRQPNFLNIVSERKNFKKVVIVKKLSLSQNRILVPIGGGKDSIVTLEKLKKKKKKIGCFLVNPTTAAKKVVNVSRVKNSVIVRRKIDSTLLKLNKKGYLNGHIPITAVLSFLSVLCAVLFSYKKIVFSNEKSANEGNLKYLGKIINHQWSKSSEFEKKFKKYIRKYLTLQINYLNILRPYTELEIAKMFLKYPRYFEVFSSCNKAIKIKKRWCGNCAKCLFVYALFYPFLEKKKLLKIFGKDIFENKNLFPIMKGLLGQNTPKPFECVGTFEENKKAFLLSLQKAKKEGAVSYLLTKLK